MVNWRQYCVIINDGEKPAVNEYRNASIDRISLAMQKIYHFPMKNREDLFSLTMKEFPNTVARFREGYIGSLEIVSNTEEEVKGMERFLSLVEN